MSKSEQYSNSDISLLVYEILKKYSNVNMRLKKKDILDKLYSLYDFKTSDKTLGKTLKRLIEFDHNIKYTELFIKKDNIPDYTDWYYDINDDTNLDDGILRYLIDVVKCNRSLLINKKEDIIDRLKSLSNTTDLDLCSIDQNKYDYDFVINEDYSNNITLLNEAIANHQEVEFSMQSYTIEKEFNILKDEDGNDKKYRVLPRDLIMSEGEYYLLATFNSNDIYQFRIDKIVKVKIAKKNTLNNSLHYDSNNLDEYTDTRCLMFTGNYEAIVIKKLDDYMIDTLVYKFDKQIEFNNTNNELQAIIKTNKKAFDIWVKRYQEFIEIIDKHR